MTRRRTQRGFTIIEVMIGLAILALALTVVLKSAAGSIHAARDAEMNGVVTELARGKMYDLEEQLLKDGFSETGLADADDACDDFEDFEDEGWPTVRWCAKIEQVELPSFDKLQEMQKGMAGSAAALAGSAGSGSAGDLLGSASGGFGDSALGGMMSMLGGGFGGESSGDADAMQGAAFVQSQYALVQQVLKDSIRKVTLVVEWDVMGSKRDLKVVAFFTDAAAMDKALQGLGSRDLDDAGAGAGGGGTGTGTGTGAGSGTRTPTRGVTP